VKATVRLSTGESPAEFRKRMREFCADKLASFKVPQKVEIVSESLHGERFKKLRSKLQ
jgi:acyl-CoA synthetase (AMP-forming)/AMP-acid ligase II